VTRATAEPDEEITLEDLGRQALLLSRRWGGFWDFYDDSQEEEIFMEALHRLMSLCEAHRMRTASGST
jgi:hypothetical protein